MRPKGGPYRTRQTQYARQRAAESRRRAEAAEPTWEEKEAAARAEAQRERDERMMARLESARYLRFVEQGTFVGREDLVRLARRLAR